jgi:hypothetical protein
VWVVGKVKAEEMVGKERKRAFEGRKRQRKQKAGGSKSRICVSGRIKWMAKQGIGQAVGYQILFRTFSDTIHLRSYVSLAHAHRSKSTANHRVMAANMYMKASPFKCESPVKPAPDMMPSLCTLFHAQWSFDRAFAVQGNSNSYLQCCHDSKHNAQSTSDRADRSGRTRAECHDGRTSGGGSESGVRSSCHGSHHAT